MLLQGKFELGYDHPECRFGFSKLSSFFLHYEFDEPWIRCIQRLEDLLFDRLLSLYNFTADIWPDPP
jgi:hypothetical protein